MKKVISHTFFSQLVLKVAHDLIGCYLVRRNGGKIERYMITETEAYDGCEDLACHASKGRTRRTEVMFGQSGVMYIYFVYGMHWMLNIVTGDVGYPAAVLIRGIQGISGPARVTKNLNITGFMNGKKLSKKSGLWIEYGSKKIPEKKIKKTARIGVSYAGPIWSKKKWRFVLKDSA